MAAIFLFYQYQHLMCQVPANEHSWQVWFKLTRSFFCYINKLIFNEMMRRSAFYKTNTLGWIFIVLADWNNSPQTCCPTRTHYPDSVPKSYLILLNTAWLSEKKQIPMLLSLGWLIIPLMLSEWFEKRIEMWKLKDVAKIIQQLSGQWVILEALGDL